MFNRSKERTYLRMCQLEHSVDSLQYYLNFLLPELVLSLDYFSKLKFSLEVNVHYPNTVMNDIWSVECLFFFGNFMDFKCCLWRMVELIDCV